MLGFSEIQVTQPYFHDAMIDMVKTNDFWKDANRSSSGDTNHAQIIYRFLNILGIRPKVNTRYASADQQQKADFMWSMEWAFDPERWEKKRSSKDSPLLDEYKNATPDVGRQGAAEHGPGPVLHGALPSAEEQEVGQQQEMEDEMEGSSRVVHGLVDRSDGRNESKCEEDDKHMQQLYTDEAWRMPSLEAEPEEKLMPLPQVPKQPRVLATSPELYEELEESEELPESRPVSLSRSSSFDRTPSPFPVHSPWTAESIFREASVFLTPWD
ncbi:hypothetical protein GUITHDRAFT_121926 [Guillardia theta CCMP2712]|uniref:Uncharacterized protein n=1 Tax=Guillardia theta (strain CCMP2712) TaxID=905079 RepID=L1I7L8_GUITC|nr:hypothetical protein GUITHDRAFT_121926 [Guillardia theta CCMP2712]EKX31879.1 hypothetical protein GUITHDRAFT_121926 [Guillardia theta CCMP2712]|eukprot:XP_005818859.1 hypothetical protein GUITHDRAFT_121926 [Guillardia theta CCMP2712]